MLCTSNTCQSHKHVVLDLFNVCSNHKTFTANLHFRFSVHQAQDIEFTLSCMSKITLMLAPFLTFFCQANGQPIGIFCLHFCSRPNGRNFPVNFFPLSLCGWLINMCGKIKGKCYSSTDGQNRTKINQSINQRHYNSKTCLQWTL